MSSLSETFASSDGRFTALVERVSNGEAQVAVIGLGYVGLPVALAFVAAGFDVIGLDVDKGKLDDLRSANPDLSDVPHDQVQQAIESNRFTLTSDYEQLRSADVILVCVPTPVREGQPDLSSVIASGEGIASVLTAGKLVILESTSYPGTTQELLKPLLESSGLRDGDDFLLAFSPERIDPGNTRHAFADIPKVIGGTTALATSVSELLYGKVVPRTVAVSSPREAELAKLIENTFRHVNIALINELAVYAHDLGIDIWEAIEAAATKPFGFMPFWPGPGWGGHCIPLDPVYLSWRIRQARDHEVRFVELAHAVNAEMPRYVVERASLLLNDVEKPIRGAKILGVGVAYKGGTADTRGSPAAKVLGQLIQRGAEVAILDPVVKQIEIEGRVLTSIPDISAISRFDLVIVFSEQHGIDWSALSDTAVLVLDCCNAIRKRSLNVVRL